MHDMNLALDALRRAMPYAQVPAQNCTKHRWAYENFTDFITETFIEDFMAAR